MTLPELQALVTRSTLLTQEEKTYWLTTLPTLQPEHMAKLEAILVEAEKVPLKESVHQYFTSLNQTAQPA